MINKISNVTICLSFVNTASFYLLHFFCSNVVQHLHFPWVLIHLDLHHPSNPNAEATFVQSTGTQRLLITILTLSNWYSLESFQMSTNVPGFQKKFSFFASF